MNQVTRGATSQAGVPRAYRKREQEPAVQENGGNPLDSEMMSERLKFLMRWRRQARVAQADNRMEMAIDEDFYDAIQMEPEDLHIMIERRQPPLVFNVVKNTINWILGTERKSRIDFRVLPRKKSGAVAAKTKTKIIKYVQDISRGEYARSHAFAECVKAGVGWLEIATRNNGDEPIFMRAERWRNMWFDHLGLEPDGRDWRYVFREKWTDLDIAEAMFPERAGALKVLADGVNSLYPYLPDDVAITDTASEFDMESDLDRLFGGPFDGIRQRVKLVECWYRMPAQVKMLSMRDDDTPYGALHGSIFRADQADHQYLVRGGYASTIDAHVMTVRCAIFAGATYLQDILSPYNHLQFPFVPMFCYRRQRDNMPYGVIRDMRDPQSDLNKRRSRALFLLTASQVIAEKDAVDDKVQAMDELQRPDGYVEINTGKKFEVQRHLELAAAHVQMANDDERFINSIPGVTDPNLGKTKMELSGKAIEGLQLQGHTTQGVVFDNLWFSSQIAGEITLSLIEQFKDQKEEFLITGDQQKDEFVTINEEGPEGIKNAITATKARFVIGKQDYRESLRLSMFSMLSELVMNLSKAMPQVALSLLDMVVDFMDDLPGKDEMVARIRKVNNQHAPEDEMTPEQKQEFEAGEKAAAQKQQMMEQMQMAMAQTQLAIKQAEAATKASGAMKNRVDAQMKKLEGFLKAMEAAGMVQANPAIVESADVLIREAASVDGGNPKPVQGGQ